MERIIRLQIEKLPEGVYLGTSDDVQGLVVEAETVAELIEYAQDAARMLHEMRVEAGFEEPAGEPVPDQFVVPLVLAA
jgi:predicted RNase H-like HicB family nuclease